MAIVRTSAIVGAISGALGDSVFRNGRAGLISAKRPAIRARASAAQMLQRAALQQLHGAWNNMSNDQRAAWAAAARSISWPNRLGVSRSPSAWNLFVTVNLTFWGGPYPSYSTAITDAPTQQTPPPTSWSVYVSPSTGVHVLADSPILPDSGLYEILYFSAAMRPFQTYAPRCWTRIGRKQVDSTDLDWTSDLIAAGVLLGPQQRIAFRVIWQQFAQVPSTPLWRAIWTPA